MKVLTIKVEESKKIMRKLLKTLGKANLGEPLEEKHLLTFPSVEKLFKTLTPVRWEIVRVLQTKEFNSIRELAQFLERDYSNVWNDIQILKDLGIVKMERTQKGYRVYVPYDRIVVEFPKTAKVPEVKSI